jgi:hypothetical protein
MNASVYRNTRFEILLIQQGPNSFGCVALARDGSTAKLQFDLHESMFSDLEMAQIHDVLRLLEEKFAAAYDAEEQDPKKAKAIIAEAIEAKRELEITRLEKQRLEIEAVALRAELSEKDAP